MGLSKDCDPCGWTILCRDAENKDPVRDSGPSESPGSPTLAAKVYLGSI